MRAFGYMLATALVAGISWTAAEAAPIVLMEDNASHEFGAPTLTLDSAVFHSGAASARVSYPDQWATFGMNLLDGQASITDITSNPVSFWYRTSVAGQVQMAFGTWTTSPVDISNPVTVTLVGDNEWHEAQVNFVAHANVANMSLDVDVKRDLRFRVRNWGGAAALETPRVVHYDLITVVPEPGALGLLGVTGLLALRRRR